MKSQSSGIFVLITNQFYMNIILNCYEIYLKKKKIMQNVCKMAINDSFHCVSIVFNLHINVFLEQHRINK